MKNLWLKLTLCLLESRYTREVFLRRKLERHNQTGYFHSLKSVKSIDSFQNFKINRFITYLIIFNACRKRACLIVSYKAFHKKVCALYQRYRWMFFWFFLFYFEKYQCTVLKKYATPSELFAVIRFYRDDKR